MGSLPPRRPGPRRGGLARLEGKIDSYIFALLDAEVFSKPWRSPRGRALGPRPAHRRAAPPRALRRTDVRSRRHGRADLEPGVRPTPRPLLIRARWTRPPKSRPAGDFAGVTCLGRPLLLSTRRRPCHVSHRSVLRRPRRPSLLAVAAARRPRHPRPRSVQPRVVTMIPDNAVLAAPAKPGPPRRSDAPSFLPVPSTRTALLRAGRAETPGPRTGRAAACQTACSLPPCTGRGTAGGEHLLAPPTGRPLLAGRAAMPC